MTNQALLLALLAGPLLAALSAWLVRGDGVRFALAVTSSLATLGLALTLVARVLQHGAIRAFSDWLYVDHLGALTLMVVTLVSALAAIYSIPYFRSRANAHLLRTGELRRYFALLHLLVFAMVAATVAGNLGLLWTAVTATTFASVPLVDFYGSHGPLEAAWKLIILAVAGELIALLGFLCLYASAATWLGGGYNFAIPVLEAAAPHLSPTLAILGFLLVLVGFGTKAGLAPMHAWLPDAYSQAPIPVCAMLSGAEVNCAMLAILRVLSLATPAAHGGADLRSALLAFGLLSMTVGVFFLVAQRDYKRLLAYSSVDQMGLIAAGVGLGAPLAVFGALLQMLAQSLAKCLMFFNAGTLLLQFRTTTIAEVRGLVRVAPVAAVLVLGGALAVAGAPPFGLFLSEVSIIAGGIGARAFGASGLIAALLVVGFIALVGPFSGMIFGDGRRLEPPPPTHLGAAVLLPGYLLLAAVLVLGIVVPGPLHTLIAAAAGEVRR